MAVPEPDPMRGVWRWAWREAKRHRGEFWLAGFFFAVVTAGAAYLLAINLHSTPTPKQAFFVALEALGLGVIAVVLLSLVFALIVAPFQQRNALRRELRDLYASVNEYSLTLDDFLYDIRVNQEYPGVPDAHESFNSKAVFKSSSTSVVECQLDSYEQRAANAVGMLDPAQAEIWPINPGSTLALWGVPTLLTSVKDARVCDVSIVVRFRLIGAPTWFRHTYDVRIELVYSAADETTFTPQFRIISTKRERGIYPPIPAPVMTTN
jgi:hypothetical protein